EECVPVAIKGDVETHVEPVVMVRRVETRRDALPVRRHGAGRVPGGLKDPGELHLELQRAVLIEVPVEAVLVVADGRYRRDHEASAPTDLGVAGVHVDVLPEDAE